MEKKNFNNLSNYPTNQKCIDEFDILLEHSSDGVLITNANGQIQHANASLCHMLGYANHEVKRKSLFDIISPQNESSFITEQQVSQCQCLLKCKDGKTQLVGTTTIKKQNDQLLIVIKDYALRIAEETAKNEKLLSDMMFQSMPGVFYLYTNQGRFLRWNYNFRTVSGYSSDEIANMHPTDFFPTMRKQLSQKRLQKLLPMEKRV